MNLSDRVAKIVAKSVVLALGFIAVGFLFVVEHMGGVLAVRTVFDYTYSNINSVIGFVTKI